MKRLIINADDLGMNAPRSHGIFAAFEQGAITSATIIPNGSHSDAAAKKAREWDMPTGLHFNIAEGFPLSPQKNVETLITAAGMFHDPDRLETLLKEDKIDPRHIEWEFRAQMEWFSDSRGLPTHLDSHYHFHVHPFVVQVLAPLLDKYGISKVRIPDEPPPPDHFEISAERLQYHELIAKRAREARSFFSAHGIASTDNFFGRGLSGNASKKAFRQLLSRLPEGTTEIMVHPGSVAAEGTAFDLDPQRQTELQMLMDETLPELLKRQKVELCSFLDI